VAVENVQPRTQWSFSINRRKLCKDVKIYVQKALDSGKEINLPFAIRSGTISKGLKYSLATGNWGAQGTQGVRAGVSQVCGVATYSAARL
jgi:DNA-directed RNA polymerase II subunit RPB2